MKKTNLDIPKKDLAKLKLVVFDSDGVTVIKGSTVIQKEKDNKLYIYAKNNLISPKMADKINLLKKRHGIMVCVSSGRSLVYLQGMYSRILGHNTILMAENGNLFLKNNIMFQTYKYKDEFFTKLYKIKEKLKRLKSVTGFEPKQFFLTAHADFEDKKVYKIIKNIDKEKELNPMWVGNEAFDIVYKKISKAYGLRHLIRMLGLKKENVMAIGDSTNDMEMVAEAGIPVSADIKKIKAPYWIGEGKLLPGEVLLDYLLKVLK